MTDTAPTSETRLQARPQYAAEWLTVKNHVSLNLAPGGDWIAKPKDSPPNSRATHIKVQALNANVRYTIDGTPASATVGFQLPAGAETLLPVPNEGVSVCEEKAGAILQYQWLR